MKFETLPPEKANDVFGRRRSKWGDMHERIASLAELVDEKGVSPILMITLDTEREAYNAAIQARNYVRRTMKDYKARCRHQELTVHIQLVRR